MEFRIFFAALLTFTVSLIPIASAQQLIETSPGTNIADSKYQENMKWIIIGLTIALIVVVIFLVPGSILHHKNRR